VLASLLVSEETSESRRRVEVAARDVTEQEEHDEKGQGSSHRVEVGQGESCCHEGRTYEFVGKQRFQLLSVSKEDALVWWGLDSLFRYCLHSRLIIKDTLEY
jgi:hypothetical protein